VAAEGDSKKKIVVGVVAVAAVLLAAIIVANQFGVVGGGPALPTQQWYFDVGTGQRFAGPIGTDPIPATSGAELKAGVPGGVMAHVYGCGGCDDRDALFTSYVEWLPAEHRTMPQGQWGRYKQVAAVTDGSTELKWVGMATADGQKVIGAAQAKCGDQKAVECPPQ
jgi:hypothetical protein